MTLLLWLAMPARGILVPAEDSPVEASHASYGLFLAPAKDIAVDAGHASYSLHFLAPCQQLSC